MFLAIVMLVGMLPFQAFAIETETTETVPETTEAAVVETEAPAEETEAPAEEETSAPAQMEEPVVPETTEEPVIPETTEEILVPETTEEIPVETEILEASQEAVLEAADPVTVYMTVSNKGVLAKTSDGDVMVNKSVTVTDVNEDGILTYDEALVAAHAEYCPGGYATSVGVYGTQVDKLWGVEQGVNYYFIKNNVALSMNVADASSTVASGDKLYAVVLSDTTRGADYYTYYTDEAKSVESGEEFTLTLKGYCTLSYPQTAAAVSGISVGTWENGTFTAIEGKSTDANGQVTLSFDKAGTYYVTASGSVSVEVTDWSGGLDEDGNMPTVQVDPPTMAPVCVVTVKAAPGAVESITLDKETAALTVGGEALTLTATVLPEDATDKTVTWTSSDEKVATVDNGVVTAVGAGTATITAKAGDVEATCEVTVTVIYGLSDLKLYRNSSAYNKGEDPLPITPEFDGSVRTGYSASAPDYYSYVYMVATMDEISKDNVNAAYITNSWGGHQGYTVTDGHVEASAYYSYSGYAGIYLSANGKSDFNREYKVTITPYTTLKALTMDGVWDQSFNRDVNAYHVYADSSAEGITIKPTAYKTAYTITINGNEVTSGTEYTLAYDWDANGKMTVEIEVSGTGKVTSTYTVELEKMPLNDAPYVMKESGEADYTVIDTASYVQDLFVTASASGNLTYQWYYNSVASTEGGTLIEGATESTYTPPVTEDVIGTRYYYCQITNDGAEEGNVTYSTPTRVTVDPDPTPVAIITNPGYELSEDYGWHVGYVYAVGEEPTGLTVEATTAVDAELTYSWKRSMKAYNSFGFASVPNESTSTTYYPLTTRDLAADTGRYYCCEVSCTFKGRTYSAMALTGNTYTEGEGDSAKTYDLDTVYVYIQVDEAATPVITTQPKGASYYVGDTMTRLSVIVTQADGGTLSYQWYVNDEPSTEGATAISSANLGTAEEIGTKYYYCVVTNTIQGHTASATSDFAEIRITTTLQEAIGAKLNGTGTVEDPYLIADAQDYQDVYDLVAEGISFEGMYLKQVNDITLSADWEPIGITKDGTHNIQSGSNLLPFSGTLDGNGKTVTVPEGGLPLLGYVKGATVKNLNIYGKQIAGYGLVNYLEGVGLSGEAICIDNVTLKSGSSTLKSGLIGTYITNNPYAGCSAAFYVTIKNCTIEKDVVIGYNKDQTYIGSIAGRVHGTIDNCVSYATVYGKDYVGGIQGTRDNAMGTYSVTNCEFYGTVVASGDHAGGIVGGGYMDSSAPNGYKICINDCTVNASITGADKVGGILGGDTFVVQAWNEYTLTNNTFSGQVKATEGTYVGGIIGYYLSLNNLETISGNTYSLDCGADRGIGFVQYVDTSYENPTKIDGVVYINTATSTEDCPAVNGCAWKTGYNRTDDPLGVDAAKLTTSAKLAASVADELMGGKSMTLSLVDAATGKAIKAANVKWSLVNAEDAAYVTLTAAGKLTASVISDSHDVVLVATVSGGTKVYHTVHVYPAAAYMDITLNGEVVTGQTLKRNINVEEEQTLTLTAELYPADAKDQVTWTPDKANIATVDENGKVTYEGKPGTVTITATAKDGSGKKATVKVTFAELTTSVTIGDHEETLSSGASMTLTADTAVVWSLKNSADKNYVTLSSNGTLKAKSVYDAHAVTVVATSKDGNASAETTVTIQPKDGTLVLKHGDANVTKTTQTVDLSDAAYELTAALYGGDAQNVTWKTSNQKIVSLSATEGETVTLNLLRAGSATITATAEDGTKTTVTIKVTTKVAGIDIVDVSGNTDDITVASGKSVKLKAVVTPANAAKKSVTWSVAKEDAAYASISILGNLTAAKKLVTARTITVYATAKDGSGIQAEQKITVQPLAQEVRLQKGTHTVNMQDQATLQLNASVYPASASQKITWKSSSTKVATVDANGTVTFLKGGTVTITATAADGSSKKASIKLTVVKSVDEIGLDDQHVAGGKSLNLAKLVEIYPTDATNKKVVWSMTGDTDSVTLNAKGVLKAKAVTEVKTVYVTATAADGYGASVTSQIDIYPATKTVTIELDGENVTGKTITLAVGESLQLTGVNAPDDAWQEWTWKSSNAKALEVDEDGCVTGITAGKKAVTITCTAADGTGRKATVKIKVVAE